MNIPRTVAILMTVITTKPILFQCTSITTTVLLVFSWIVITGLVAFRALTLFPRGCQFRPTPVGGYLIPPLEIKEGVVLGNMLLKVILKPIKVMITCKIVGPYLKNSARYRDLKNLSFWDFVLPWLTEIAITRSIFEIQGSYFGFSSFYVFYKSCLAT